MPINTNKLRGIIAEKGLSQAKVAKAIGVTPRGFCNKMKKGAFSCNELEQMAAVLGITHPWETLFLQNHDHLIINNDRLIIMLSQLGVATGENLLADFMERYNLPNLAQATSEQLQEFYDFCTKP